MDKFPTYTQYLKELKNKGKLTEYTDPTSGFVTDVLVECCENNRLPVGLKPGDLVAYTSGVSSAILLCSIIGPIFIVRNFGQTFDPQTGDLGPEQEYVSVITSKDAMNVVELGLMDTITDSEYVDEVLRWYLGGYDAEMNHWDDFNTRLEYSMKSFQSSVGVN